MVAGHEGLERLVERANVMEVPDIMAWVKPRELLLTTGYPLRDAPGGMAALVTALDELGVSAIAVKLRRYLDELPADMLSAADAVGLPLLLLPDDVRLRRPAERRRRARSCTARHRSSTGAVSSTSGSSPSSSTVADSTSSSRPCTTASAVRRSSPPPTAGSWPQPGRGSSFPMPSPDRTLFVESGRFRSERFAPGLHQPDRRLDGRGRRHGRARRPRPPGGPDRRRDPRPRRRTRAGAGRDRGWRWRSPSRWPSRPSRRSTAATSSATCC